MVRIRGRQVIEEKDITVKTEAIVEELRRAFGIRTKSLTKALRKAGRRLPTHLQKKAGSIVQAQNFGGNPKLMRMVDSAEISNAYDEIMSYLEQIDPKQRRVTMTLDILAELVLKLIIVGTLVVVVLRWQGYL